VTKDEFREFVRETMFGGIAGQFARVGSADVIDKIVDQWENDTTESWQRGVEVGRESAS
jgi:hypothetical protein